MVPRKKARNDRTVVAVSWTKFRYSWHRSSMCGFFVVKLSFFRRGLRTVRYVLSDSCRWRCSLEKKSCFLFSYLILKIKVYIAYAAKCVSMFGVDGWQ